MYDSTVDKLAARTDERLRRLHDIEQHRASDPENDSLAELLSNFVQENGKVTTTSSLSNSALEDLPDLEKSMLSSTTFVA